MRKGWILCLISALLGECWTEERIIGGTNAAPGEAPFMVSLRGAYNFHICGGSIIDNRWVLTAQICLRGNFAYNIEWFVAGTTSLDDTTGVRYRVQKKILHEDPNENIALIKSEIPIIFNANVQPIPLGIFPLASGTTVKIYGWGMTSNPGAQSQTLKMLVAKAIDHEECVSRFPEAERYRIVPTLMCELPDSGTGTCGNDEGGPHVANGQLYGLAWSGCANGDPLLSTRVSSYILWIMRTKLFNMF